MLILITLRVLLACDVADPPLSSHRHPRLLSWAPPPPPSPPPLLSSTCVCASITVALLSPFPSPLCVCFCVCMSIVTVLPQSPSTPPLVWYGELRCSTDAVVTTDAQCVEGVVVTVNMHRRCCRCHLHRRHQSLVVDGTTCLVSYCGYHWCAVGTSASSSSPSPPTLHLW